MTGAVCDEVHSRAREASVFAVLPKPLHLGQLFEAIQSALEDAYDCAR